MAEAKASKKKTSGGRSKTKSATTKRRGANSQNQGKRPPTKAALRQLAKDWDQVT